MKSVRKLTKTWKQTKNLHEESLTKNNDKEKLKRIPVSPTCIEFSSHDTFDEDYLKVPGERIEGDANDEHATKTVAHASTSCRRTSKRLVQKDTTQSQGTPSQILPKQLKVQASDIIKHVRPFSKSSIVSSSTLNRTTTKDVTHTRSTLPNSNDACSLGNLLLSSWGIPASVLEKYEEYGIKNMFEWQAECLSLKRVLQGGNLVYSAPTSAGKTLVAELLMLKCVLERKKKAMMILPFVSVTHEKISNLRKLFLDAGVRVDGYMGSHSPPGGLSAVDIAVCTIEKANSLVNGLIENNELNSLGIIVVDELHMVGDFHRGYLLELLLTKVRYIQLRNAEKSHGLGDISNPIQIIGMSATLPNLDLLASWINAELYCTHFRPVPLTECLKIGSSIYRTGSMELLRDLPKEVSFKDDQDNVVHLCLETICDGHGVLVFCPTKAWCEKLAQTIARTIYELGRDDFQDTNTNSKELAQMHDKIRENLNVEKLRESLGHLRSSPAGLDISLSQTVAYGVAFHHAGLTFDERDIIEAAFRQGTIKVLTATSTLSSGVNLPARRVIIRTPVFHGGALISVLSYKQMVGRAGRKGLDDAGESILICSENDKHKACGLTQSQLPPVHSCLQVDGQLQLSSSLKRAVLEIIVSGIAKTLHDVRQYVDLTLLAASASKSSIEKKVISDCLHFLAESEFIRLQSECRSSCFPGGASDSNNERGQGAYVATSLGSAVLASAFSPDEGLIVFQELERARRCFVLENELHIIYQVTPIYLSEQWSGIDWHHYWQMWEGLTPSFKRVGECVGVEERFLMRASRQGTSFSLSTPKQVRQLGVHLRFYTALALHDLVNEIPLPVVARKFCCNRGMLQSLQQAAGTFAGMVTIFCHKLGWINLELLLAHFQNRLHFGIQQELCDLVRISCLNGLVARMLYNAGYKTVAAVANATVPSVEKVLMQACPFESTKVKENETAKEAMRRVESRAVWLPGKKNIAEREAAHIIIAEAREIIQHDFGVRNVEWMVANGGSETNPEENNTKSASNSSVDVQIESATDVNRSIRHDTIVRENVNNETRDLCLENTGSGAGCWRALSGPRNVPLAKTVEKRNDSGIESNPQKEKIPSLEHSQNSSQVQSLASSQEHPVVLLLGSVSAIATPLTCEPTSELERTRESLSKDDYESSNSLFDDELMLNTQVLENLDKSARHCTTNTWEISQSPALVSLHFNENNETGAHDGQHFELDTTTFSEAKSLHLSALSETGDSDRTPSLIVDDNDDEAYLEQITGLIEKSPMEPQQSSDHPATNDDVFINDSLFDCVGTVCTKKIGDDPTRKVDLKNSEGFASYHDGSGIANIDGSSEELFGEAASAKPIGKPDVLKNCDESCSLRDSSFEDGELDVAVIFETQDIFSQELDIDVFKARTVSMTNELISKVSDTSNQIKPESKECVDSLDEEQSSQFIPPTPTKPTSASVKLFGKNRSILRSVNRSKTTIPLGLAENSIVHGAGEILRHNTACQGLITARNDDIGNHLPTVAVKLIRQSLQSETKIMNIFEDKGELEKFMQMWRTKSRFAFAFAGEKRLPDIPIVSVIGHNILKGKHPSQKAIGTIPKSPFIRFNDADVMIVGLAVCWDATPYYIDFSPKDNCCKRTGKTELNQFLVNLSMQFNPNHPKTIISYDMKDQLRALYHVCGMLPSNILLQDPRVASWLLDPEFSKLTLYQFVEKYLPHRLCLLKDFAAMDHQGGLAFYVGGQKTACIRTTAEVILTRELMDQLSDKMQKAGLTSAFNDIEMASLLPLVKLELNGFGVCGKELERQKVVLETKRIELEKIAFVLAGREFSMSSSKEVAKVLYSELKLSVPNAIIDTDEEPSPVAVPMRLRKVRGSPAGMLKKLRPRRQSFVGKTNKSTLRKFGDCHDLPKVVLEWRQINNSLNKIVIPVSECKHYDSKLKMHRLYSTYSTFTATGRVASADPSVQMVPREFVINLLDEDEGGSKILNRVYDSKTSQAKAIDKHSSSRAVKPVVICPRQAFIASIDSTLVAADYSQLELRVLAHLSRDEDLILALNNDTDVFKSIAAKWKGCKIEDVNDNLRQQAKQICYGMIYGVGAKSLASNLNVDEDEATAFIESFKSKYPGIQKFIQSTIEKCKKVGYVETMMGRRRFLPSISSRHLQVQQHAERQAVNTTVQGSAADIVKRAMIGIDKQLEEEFPQTRKPLCQNSWLDDSTTHGSPGLPRGGFFVLQLHDELLYETSEEDAVQVAQIVKMNMERTMQLSVKLTVKIKFGSSWGTLREVDI